MLSTSSSSCSKCASFPSVLICDPADTAQFHIDIAGIPQVLQKADRPVKAIGACHEGDRVHCLAFSWVSTLISRPMLCLPLIVVSSRTRSMYFELSSLTLRSESLQEVKSHSSSI